MPRVDTREPKFRTEPLVRAGWVLATLKYGDYDGNDATGKLWVVEHKTVDKMLLDMRSGVLIRQCRSMVEHCDFPILMIEGQWIHKEGTLWGTGITWDQAWNQLQTIQDMGCRIQLTTPISHTIERLFSLADYYSKAMHKSAFRQLSGDPYISVLSQINGIDSVKARRIEQVFPTLLDIVTASPDQIQQVEGIGEILSKRIWDFWRISYA